jgi:hypothetical protein
VQVTWMPHTTLSQTSHVCLTIRSAHASLDALLTDDDRPQDWKVRVSVYGVAGLLLVPVFSHTPAAQVRSRKRARDEPSSALAAGQQSRAPRPTVSDATHDCIWDTYVTIPIRWRDLPRDAYLLFEVLGQADTVVSLVALLAGCFSDHRRTLFTHSPCFLRSCRYTVRQCLSLVDTANSRQVFSDWSSRQTIYPPIVIMVFSPCYR